MSKIRVLVVDDTVVIRRLVSEVVNRDSELELAGVAANGKIALQKMTQVSPDVVTLDMEMPELDGIATLKELRKTYPEIPVIMLSSSTKRAASSTLDALAAGANDYVTKPVSIGNVSKTIESLQSQLVPLIKTHFKRFKRRQQVSTPKSQPTLTPKPRRKSFPTSKVGIVAIGSSTGGPNALTSVFEALQTELPVPIVIVQHMPPIFTKSLADRLDRLSPTRVFEATDGQEILPGCAYLAPGGKHLEIERRGDRVFAKIHDGPPENSCRPAVDVLFRSVAEYYGPSTLAVVLTGMGKDGYLGCRNICENGGTALAQDEATSVVWGMPSYISNEGLAEETLPLSEIAPAILKRVKAQRSFRSPVQHPIPHAHQQRTL